MRQSKHCARSKTTANRRISPAAWRNWKPRNVKPRRPKAESRINKRAGLYVTEAERLRCFSIDVREAIICGQTCGDKHFPRSLHYGGVSRKRRDPTPDELRRF